MNIFKRRGPPLNAPVLIDTRPQRLAAFLAASQTPSHNTRQRPPSPVTSPPAFIDLSDLLRKPLYALDRVTSPSFEASCEVGFNVTRDPGFKPAVMGSTVLQGAIGAIALGFTPRVALIEEAVVMEV